MSVPYKRPLWIWAIYAILAFFILIFTAFIGFILFNIVVWLIKLPQMDWTSVQYALKKSFSINSNTKMASIKLGVISPLLAFFLYALYQSFKKEQKRLYQWLFTAVVVFLIFAFIRYLNQALPYVERTLSLSFFGVTIGFSIALMVVAMRLSHIPFLRRCAYGWVFIFRGTPFLVQIYLLWFGLGNALAPTINAAFDNHFISQIWNEPYWWCLVALSFNSSAYGAEIIRGGLLSVDNKQLEAAKAYGMSHRLVFKRIRLKQAIAQALPSYSNEVILVLKATVIASTVLSLTDFWDGYTKSSSRYYEVFAPLIAIGLFYFLFNYMLARLFRHMEKKANPWIYKNQSH